MKAVVLHRPGDLRVDDVPDPILPPGGVVLRTAAVGICGSDVRTSRLGSSRLRGPQTLGHEFAGIVTASDVAGFPVGMAVAVCPGAPCMACRACGAGRGNLCRQRRVLGYDLPGGMAEMVAIPSDWFRTDGVVALDPASPIEGGAIVEPVHTVLNGQDEARIGPGDAVLVLGLGPIGVLHVAVARSRGATTVIGVDPDIGRVARSGGILGPSAVTVMDAGWQARVGAAVDGGGFDVVVVAAGSQAALRTAIDLSEPGGRILAFAGLPADDTSFALDMDRLHYRQLSIVGAFGGTPAHFRRAAAWLAGADFDLAAFAPQTYRLEDAITAFAAVANGRGLKTLLIPG